MSASQTRRAGVQRVDRHLPLGRAGDLDPPVRAGPRAAPRPPATSRRRGRPRSPAGSRADRCVPTSSRRARRAREQLVAAGTELRCSSATNASASGVRISLAAVDVGSGHPDVHELPSTSSSSRRYAFPDRCTDGGGDGRRDGGVEHARHDVARRSARPAATASAIAVAAASSISSVISCAPASSMPAEEAGEREHVVDLVREVRPAGGDDGGVLAAPRPGRPPGRGWPARTRSRPSAIVAMSSPVSRFGAETPMNTSAPDEHSLSVPSKRARRWCSRRSRDGTRPGPLARGAPRPSRSQATMSVRPGRAAAG